MGPREHRGDSVGRRAVNLREHMYLCGWCRLGTRPCAGRTTGATRRSKPQRTQHQIGRAISRRTSSTPAANPSVGGTHHPRIQPPPGHNTHRRNGQSGSLQLGGQRIGNKLPEHHAAIVPVGSATGRATAIVRLTWLMATVPRHGVDLPGTLAACPRQPGRWHPKDHHQEKCPRLESPPQDAQAYP